MFIRYDTLAPVYFQSFRSVCYQWVWRSAERHDNHVCVQFKPGTGNDCRTAAATAVGFPERHFYAAHAAYPPLFVAEYFHRIGQQVKDDAFFFRMMHFFYPRRQLVFRAAIDNHHLRAQPQGRAGGVHRHVAAADYRHPFTYINRRVISCVVRPHQVVARQEFIGGDHAVQVFARNAHEFRQSCAGGDEYRLKFFFIE